MSEEIDTKLSTMSVWDAQGVQVDKKDAPVDLNDPDHKTLLVSLDTGSITNGVLTVKYHTVTPDDNGITDGTFRFVVGSAAATPAPDVTATPTTPESGQATPIPGATATPAASAAATPTAGVAPTPAALPKTGESRANAGWIIGLLGVVLVGGGLAVLAILFLFAVRGRKDQPAEEESSTGAPDAAQPDKE